MVLCQILTLTLSAHDLWLSAKWNAKKTHILIAPVVGEVFPNGEATRNMSRFTAPAAYFPGGRRVALEGDTKDSTILDSFPAAPSSIIEAGVKERDITYNDSIAHLYLVEEIGLTKAEAEVFITPGVKEFSEKYSRHLKVLVTTGDAVPTDSLLGMPLELVVTSWKQVDTTARVQFRLFESGRGVAGAPVRIVSGGNTQIVTTDTTGAGEATVSLSHPALLAHIKLTKETPSQLRSVWTNTAIYRLRE